MTSQKGSMVLIKVGNGASPEVFTTIGGLSISELILNNHALDNSTLESGAWRQLLPHGGISFMSISGSGRFTNSASEETVRGHAFANDVSNYQFVFANGDTVTGPFLVSNYHRSGNYDGAELFALTLESAGTITFV